MVENEKLAQEILKKVKQNRKYSSLSDDIIIFEIGKYLKSNPKVTSLNKQTIKKIRAKLHRIYSSYQLKKKRKLEIYLDDLKKIINKPLNKKELKELTNKLLSLVLSAKERLSDYEFIYSEIFKITGKPRVIIDLGSGLNPFSYPLMNLKKLNYYAYDIDTSDVNSLNKYFKIMKPLGLKGKAEILDIRNLKKLKQLPDSDIIFMFKLFDLLDKKTKKQIIPLLIKKTKFLVISFATKTFTRKAMKLKVRTGFEKMLEKNKWKFNKIKTGNEVFYVIQLSY